MAFKHTLYRLLYPLWKPRMIWGYRTPEGILRNVRISSSTFIDHPGQLILGDHVFIGHFNFIEASQGMEIGEGCQVTNFVSITTHSSHHSLRVHGKSYTNTVNPTGYARGPVRIGAYTFIGPHAVVMPGTTIGRGCIVSAFSYVQGHFPDFSIISGNPATVTGDVRKTDMKLLEDHPELKSHYDEWQNRIPPLQPDS